MPKPTALLHRTLHPWMWPLTAALCTLALSCRQEQIQHYRVPKESAAPAAPMAMPEPGGMPGGMPAGAGMPEGGASAKAEVNPIHWSLPSGWAETPGDGMRFATLKLPVAGRVEASVVVLPGPAGGELANVNRWRGQIALAPIDEPALAKLRTVVKSKAGAVNVYDFTSDGQTKTRVVAGLITTADGNTWFLKLTGDATLVAKARPDFMQILGSLHLD